MNPILESVFRDPKNSWYFPWEPSEEIRSHELYQKAVEEGWHEWIQSDLDWTAVKKGFVFDLSRDHDGKPAYFIDGMWQLHDGTRIAVEDEDQHIAHCGKGDAFLRFAEVFLTHQKEELAGKPYTFIPWQRKFCAELFGWVNRKTSYRRYQTAYVAIAKKNGKLLSDDTPIPTPCGWKNHGDLQVGDKLFDAVGGICEVIQVHPKHFADCEVEFTNGERIKCHGDHLWVTERLDRRSYSAGTRSTDTIRGTLKTSQGALRHRIAMHSGVQCTPKELPVNPYVLGCWLGDGDTAGTRISVGDEDELSLTTSLADCGIKVRSRYSSKGKIALTIDYSDAVVGKGNDNKLKKDLRSINVLRNKHIPLEYLRASKEQRLSLLQGLMDTDGTISKSGLCISFSQKSELITDQVCELLASLGIKYSKKPKISSCNGKSHKSWVVQFHVFREDYEVFRMPRKIARQRSRQSLKMSTGRSRHVHIKSITPIAPVQGNCITVSGDGTYLCGRTMLPTHNSALLSIISLYCLIGEGKQKSYVYSCACDRNQARIIYTESANMAKSSAVLGGLIEVVDSRSRLVHQDSGSFYQVLASDSGRNDGIDSSCTLVDEIHRHPNRRLISVMKRAGLARKEPLMITITTYGPSTTDGSIWAEIHNAGKAQMVGDRPDNWRNLVLIASAEPIPVTLTADVPAGCTRLPVDALQQPVDSQDLKFVLSVNGESSDPVEVRVAEPAKRYQTWIDVEPIPADITAHSEAIANEDWTTDAAIMRANPSCGIVFDIEVIRKEIRDSRESPATEAETKQLCLNIASGSGNKWISSAAWKACTKHKVNPDELMGLPAFGGLDLSFGTDLTAFCLAIPRWDVDMTTFLDLDDPRVDLLTWAWLPTHEIIRREEKEEFSYRYYSKLKYFKGQGCIRFCEGHVIDFAQVAADILDICQHFQVRCIATDPNYASFVVPKLEEEAGLVCVAHRQGGVSMAPPSKRFAEAVYGGWLGHGGNPVLTRAVEGAILNQPDRAGNTFPCKTKSYNRIDPLVAAIMALGFAVNPPEGYDGAYGSDDAGMW